MEEPAAGVAGRISSSQMLNIVLLIVILAFFCVRNLPWHLDDFDQAKQAYTSFEMISQGHWWFQHTPMQNVATKPPLAGWMSAAIFAFTRCWDVAWRLPSLVSALVILLILRRAGGRIFPEIGGLLAMAAFGFNLMAPRLATLVRTDMLLTLFIFLAGYVIYEKVRAESPWTQRDRWMIFLLVLGSMLTKGPIAYAFLLPGLVAFQWICRRRRAPANAWSGAWSWFVPLLVFLVWAAIGMMRDRQFFEQVVLKEFLGRFTVGEQAVHKNQPVYFYLAHLFRDLLPWSLPLLVFPFFSEMRRRLLADPGALWLLCWSLGGLVFMSLVPSKRPDRIFPVVPPLCLLLVHWAREIQMKQSTTKRLIALLTMAAFMISGSYVVLNVLNSYRLRLGTLVEFGRSARDLARSRELPIAITTSKDEGLLLYLEVPQFRKWRDAAADWKAGKLDLLILPHGDFKNVDLLTDWKLLRKTGPVPEKNDEYFLIGRRGAQQP